MGEDTTLERRKQISFNLELKKTTSGYPVYLRITEDGLHKLYSPKATFGNLFRKINEIKVSEKLSRVRFNAGPESVEVTVKYPRPQNKYIDDIEDLEAEIGPLAGHKGETLTYTLKQLADIVEREHVKKKSYMGLISYLKKIYDIKLDIK
ncbi:MAG: hypothetical protein K6E37_00145 [Bacteroidales bacterium]|nr:hypothetical protein [Bacteroidales bacterium]